MASIKLAGDTSGEITISAPAVAGTTTLTLPATSSTLATQNALGVRNLFINGDMRIDQRNAGASVTSAALTGGVYTLDRWRVYNGTDGVFTTQQSTTAPENFEKSVVVTVTTADAILGAGQQAKIMQRLEGYNLGHLRWGTANAKTVTLSFWVQSSVTGTYGIGFINGGVNRSYVATYTINSANTWEYKTITIEGDTTGTWLTNNGIGLNVQWSLGMTASYETTSGSWQTGEYSSTSGSVNLMATSGATFYLTGVQLEADTDTATPFEHRPYDMELARCQRYYQQETATRPGYIPTTTDTNRHQQLWWKVQMRATPTITATWAAGSNNVGSNTTTGAWIYSGVGDTTTGRNLNSWTASAEL